MNNETKTTKTEEKQKQKNRKETADMIVFKGGRLKGKESKFHPVVLPTCRLRIL